VKFSVLPIAVVLSTTVSLAYAKEIPSEILGELPVAPLRQAEEPAKPAKAVENQIPAVPAHVMKQPQLLAEGSADSTSHLVVRPGVNQIIPISIGHPNRLVTPFAQPEIVSSTLSASGSDGQCGELCVKQNVVYVATDAQHPVTMFITEAGSQDQAISLTLMPRRIPPREIFLRFAEDHQPAIRRRAQLWEQSQPYVQTIKEVFRSIALGEIPRGYSLGAVTSESGVPVCTQKDTKIAFEQMLDGHHLRVFVATVQNTGKAPVDFKETSCGGENVVAVAAYPHTHLKPTQKTELYVAIRGTETVPPARLRESLLGAR